MAILIATATYGMTSSPNLDSRNNPRNILRAWTEDGCGTSYIEES